MHLFSENIVYSDGIFTLVSKAHFCQIKTPILQFNDLLTGGALGPWGLC